MKRELVSGAELARRLGVSRQAVAGAVKTGRLAHHDAAQSLFDLDAALTMWHANAQRLRVPRGTMSDAQLIARARLEAARAELSELRLGVERGQLLNADQVRERAFAWGQLLRDTVATIPDRLAAELAAESSPAKVRERLLVECRRLVEIAERARPYRDDA